MLYECVKFSEIKQKNSPASIIPGKQVAIVKQGQVYIINQQNRSGQQSQNSVG